MFNVCVVQARLNSNRLPNKIFYSFKDTNILNYILKKLKYNSNIHKLILAVPENQLSNIKYKAAYYDEIYGGSENDLINRYYDSVKNIKENISSIIRITSDCPCVNMDILNNMVEVFNKKIKTGYLCNTNFEGCMPSGLDIEIFDFKSLKIINEQSKEREHLAIAFGKNLLNIPCYSFSTDGCLNNIELSLDTIEDLDFIKKYYNNELLNNLKIDLNKVFIKKLIYDHSVHCSGRERRS